MRDTIDCARLGEKECAAQSGAVSHNADVGGSPDVRGGALFTTAAAQAESTQRFQVRTSIEAVWAPFANYPTHEGCRQRERDMTGAGIVIDYKCDWDSAWLLRVRIE
ncbi:hypothetical protein [Streptosporangium sp. NPDC002607]